MGVGSVGSVQGVALPGARPCKGILVSGLGSPVLKRMSLLLLGKAKAVWSVPLTVPVLLRPFATTPFATTPLSNSHPMRPRPLDLSLRTDPDAAPHAAPHAAFIPPGRSYREELYAARRFELPYAQSPAAAFRKLHAAMLDEGIAQAVRARRHFLRPGLVLHALQYAGRRRRFNQRVQLAVARCLRVRAASK